MADRRVMNVFGGTGSGTDPIMIDDEPMRDNVFGVVSNPAVPQLLGSVPQHMAIPRMSPTTLIGHNHTNIHVQHFAQPIEDMSTQMSQAPPPPPYGPASRSLMRDSPEKAGLRRDKAMLEHHIQQALHETRVYEQRVEDTEITANALIQANKDMMEQASLSQLQQARDGFEGAATAYQAEARSVISFEIRVTEQDAQRVVNSKTRAAGTHCSLPA